MADSLAMIGYDSEFKIGSGSSAAVPGTLTAVAEVTGIKGLKFKKDQVEVTHLKSPNKFKEFIDGMKDFDAVQISFNYVPGGTAETALLAAFNAATRKVYQIEYPNGATWTFLGVMTEFAPGDVAHDKKLEGTATIKPSGDPLIDDGAA